MQNAARILICAAAFAGLAGCHNKAPQAHEQNIMVDNRIPPGAEIETLPADESSTTPSNELQSGYDNPDVNETSANASQ